MLESTADVATHWALRGARVLYVAARGEHTSDLVRAVADNPDLIDTIKTVRRTNGSGRIEFQSGGRIDVRAMGVSSRGLSVDVVLAPPSVWEKHRADLALCLMGSEFFAPSPTGLCYSTLERIGG